MGWFKAIKEAQWKDLDPTNKHGALGTNLRNLDKHVVQPLEKDALLVAFTGIPAVGPLAAAYFAALFLDAPSHRALPLWLRIVLQDQHMYDHIDLTKVSYHENSHIEQYAITIGYNIFIKGTIHIQGPNVDYNDLLTILHELQHCVQYERGGGIGPVFSKIVAQYGGQFLNGGPTKNIHDDAALEAEAIQAEKDYGPRVWADLPNFSIFSDGPRRGHGDVRPRGGRLP
jgi:hypothetical protein